MHIPCTGSTVALCGNFWHMHPPKPNICLMCQQVSFGTIVATASDSVIVCVVLVLKLGTSWDHVLVFACPFIPFILCSDVFCEFLNISLNITCLSIFSIFISSISSFDLPWLLASDRLQRIPTELTAEALERWTNEPAESSSRLSPHLHCHELKRCLCSVRFQRLKIHQYGIGRRRCRKMKQT